MLTCFIRYDIDPARADAFETYARNWNAIIPRCGGNLIGYFAPHTGSATTGYALIGVDSLADYEAYRAHLRDDAAARDNFDFARRERFIRYEDRMFLTRV
jgi:hypothetical protein